MDLVPMMNTTVKPNSSHKSNDEGIYFQRALEDEKWSGLAYLRNYKTVKN